MVMLATISTIFTNTLSGLLMPTSQITIKHNKHRAHPCPKDKKLSLLNQLIANNKEAEILVVSTENIELLKDIAADNVTVMNDEELFNSKANKYELLISYDLPTTAADYMSRLEHAKEMALILLDSNEQKQLYPIETLLGRAIKQEKIEGFEYEETKKMKIAQKPVQKPKREYEFKKEYEKKPKYDKAKRDNNSNDKSKKWENKDKYNAPKKVGRKIAIKARKPQDGSDSNS